MLGARRGRKGEGLVCRGGSDLCCRRGILLCFAVCDLSDGVGGVIWLGGWDRYPFQFFRLHFAHVAGPPFSALHQRNIRTPLRRYA